VSLERIGAVMDAILALYQRISSARGITVPSDLLAVEAETIDDPARHLWALAGTVPMGPADRYAVLAAPTLAERVTVLLDAIESVTAIVNFTLSQD
jgi:Lon protease-like protein